MAKQKRIRDQYLVYVNGQTVEVTPDVYHVWYGGERKERYQQERDAHFGVLPFSSMGDEQTEILEVLPAVENTEATVEQNETYRDLYAALRRLPEKEQDIVTKIYFRGIPKAQIARQEGVCENAIYKREQRALKHLKKYF